jgi:serine/threonine-protein kinase
MRGAERWLALALWSALGCGTQHGKLHDAEAAESDAGDSDDGSVRDASSGAHDAGAAAQDGAAQSNGASGYFPRGSWFLEDVYDAPAASNSKTAMAALRARGGWGNGNTFQIDFSIDVLSADANTQTRDFVPRSEANGFDEEFFSPDCDQVPMPVPNGGNVEGEQGYACTKDGDCHLLVWMAAQHKLYEMWRADISSSRFVGGCLAVWDTSRPLTAAGRGVQCTSADAAGFPIAPLLFSADEVQAGAIEHAIRFVLPNDRPRRGFVPPATHGTATTGPDDAPYYGVHLRLRRDYPLDNLPSQGAKVVARALQHYGMYHADGGQIALTAQSDRHTQHKWSGLLSPQDLRALKVEDFEVIDHGAPIPLTYDCER